MVENKNKGLKLLVCLSIIAVLITVTSVVSAQVPPPENDVIVEVTPGSQTGAPGDTLMFNVTLTNNGTVPDIIVVDSITGVPSGWTVELKDAGVPRTLPYQTPLLENKTNYLLTLDVHVPADATAGATITINIYSFADISKTDADTFDVVLGTPSPCFIATAAYGTPVHEDINILRKFRNEVLSTNTPGKAIVETYYSTSPPIANALSENRGLRTAVRLLLITPLLYVASAVLTLKGIPSIILILGACLCLIGTLLFYFNSHRARARNLLRALGVGIMTGAVLTGIVFSLGWLAYIYTLPICAVVAAYILPIIIPLSIGAMIFAGKGKNDKIGSEDAG